MENELDGILLSELDRLYRFMYNRTRDAYRAEELAQEAVLAAYRAYPRLRDKSRIVPWLWGIARNVYMRSLKEPFEIPEHDVVIIDKAGVSYETPENEYLKKIGASEVRRAVSCLAKQYRDVCVLFWLENKDYLAISRELGIPLSSVKWRLNQAKSQLREEFDKMEYMENKYHRAIPLTITMGGWVGEGNPRLGNYDNADQALGSLLPQNICLAAYREPKTVTGLSSELGVAADYVEEALARLTATRSVRKSGNKYQAMFPIWDEAALDDIFGGNYRYAEEEAGDIVDMLFSLEKDVSEAGFYGCDKGMEKLILFSIGYICQKCERNKFETEKLPFQGDDKAWYILAWADGSFPKTIPEGKGVSSNRTAQGLNEYYFYQEHIPDNRSRRKEELEALYRLYLGEPVAGDYDLSKLVESGKTVRNGSRYTIAVPVLSGERGDLARLDAALAPAIAKADALQDRIYRRSCETVARYIPKHISGQAGFFGSYCAHSVLETAFFAELMKRKTEITADMVMWYTVK